MTASPIGTRRAGSTRWIWALAGIALAFRLALAIEAPPVIAFLDGREYEAVALSLLHHSGFGGFVLRPPGYPTVMAAVWAVTGRDLLALRIVEAMIGAGAVALLTWTGIRHLGKSAGIVAGALAAVHPVLAFLPSTQYCENTLFAVMTGAGACMLAALDAPGRALRMWAGAGLLLGLACLWRANMVLFVPGMLAAAGFTLVRQRRPVVVPLMLCVLAMAATLAPWTIRNHRAYQRWFFVGIGGGRALWLGNNPQLDATHYRNAEPDPELAARLAAAPSVFEQDELLRREGWREIRRDPARAVSLYGLKLRVLLALWPETQTHTRWMIDSARWAQGLLSVVMFIGVLLAFGRLGRAPPMWPLVGGALTYLLGTALFFTTMRYRMPVEPVFLWLSGIGWASILSLRRAAAPVPMAEAV
jgi:4-amino-4-deoxy-L-arabinose transferase-like glycosyltransferase